MQERTWSDRAEAAHRGGQHSWGRVAEGRARRAWAREESMRRRAENANDNDEDTTANAE